MKKNLLLIGIATILCYSTAEAQVQKIPFSPLKIDFPAALSSQEEEWLQNCQFIQSADHPLELTCLWQQEYVDLFHGKWRQWSVRFDASGNIQPTQPMIYPALDQDKIFSGEIVAVFPGQNFLVYSPEVLFDPETNRFDIDVFDLDIITNGRKLIFQALGSMKAEPVDALVLSIGSMLILGHQYSDEDLEETPIEQRIDFDPYVLNVVDTEGHVDWQIKEEYIQGLWQKQVGHLPTSRIGFGQSKSEFLVGADKGNVVVAGIRSWPIENGQTAKLESGAFIACYSIDGTYVGIVGTYLGTILLPEVPSSVNPHTLKLTSQGKIVGAWLASDQEPTEKDELIVNHWMQNCNTNKDGRPAWHLALPNNFANWKEGVNTYIKAIQPASNGHLFVLYVQQRAQAVCFKLKGKRCEDQEVFQKNPELLRPSLFLMEIDEKGQIIANQAIIGVNDPAGWALSYVESFKYTKYKDQDIDFHLQAGMTLTGDKQHLLIFIINPSAASFAIRQAGKEPQGQLLLYQVKIQP